MCAFATYAINYKERYSYNQRKMKQRTTATTTKAHKLMNSTNKHINKWTEWSHLEYVHYDWLREEEEKMHYLLLWLWMQKKRLPKTHHINFWSRTEVWKFECLCKTITFCQLASPVWIILKLPQISNFDHLLVIPGQRLGPWVPNL